MARRKLLRGEVLHINEDKEVVLLYAVNESKIFGYDYWEQEIVELDREEILSRIRKREWYINLQKKFK